MSTRAAAMAVLAVLATTALATPLLAVAVDCADDGGDECCILDCAICLCCAQTPQTLPSDLAARSGGGPDGGLGPAAVAAPDDPSPRDILHVPKRRPSL